MPVLREECEFNWQLCRNMRLFRDVLLRLTSTPVSYILILTITAKTLSSIVVPTANWRMRLLLGKQVKMLMQGLRICFNRKNKWSTSVTDTWKFFLVLSCSSAQRHRPVGTSTPARPQMTRIDGHLSSPMSDTSGGEFSDSAYQAVPSDSRSSQSSVEVDELGIESSQTDLETWNQTKEWGIMPRFLFHVVCICCTFLFRLHDFLLLNLFLSEACEVFASSGLSNCLSNFGTQLFFCFVRGFESLLEFVCVANFFSGRQNGVPVSPVSYASDVSARKFLASYAFFESEKKKKNFAKCFVAIPILEFIFFRVRFASVSYIEMFCFVACYLLGRVPDDSGSELFDDTLHPPRTSRYQNAKCVVFVFVTQSDWHWISNNDCTNNECRISWITLRMCTRVGTVSFGKSTPTSKHGLILRLRDIIIQALFLTSGQNSPMYRRCTIHSAKFANKPHRCVLTFATSKTKPWYLLPAVLSLNCGSRTLWNSWVWPCFPKCCIICQIQTWKRHWRKVAN